MSKGIFISMEGPDGSGKSTQIALLKEYLENEGYDVLITREPGGNRISEAIREIILNKEYEEMSPVTEMMLYASARAQLIAQVIGPAIDEGKAVISDRFIDSSLVYQGMARGLGVETAFRPDTNSDFFHQVYDWPRVLDGRRERNRLLHPDDARRLHCA